MKRSRLFFLPNGEPVVSPARFVEKCVYDGGSFAMYSRDGKPEWVESKVDGSAEFRVAEARRDKEWIHLFDASRGMDLGLPVDGGTCSWSTNDGKTWNALYQVEKAKSCRYPVSAGQDSAARDPATALRAGS